MVDVLTLESVMPPRFFEEVVVGHGVDKSCRAARQLRTYSILDTQSSALSGIDLPMAAAGGSQGYATVEPAAVASVQTSKKLAGLKKALARSCSRAQMSGRWRFASPTRRAQARRRRRRRRQGGQMPIRTPDRNSPCHQGSCLAFPGTAKNGTTMWGLSRPSASSPETTTRTGRVF